MDLDNKRQQELDTVRFMIDLYCRKQHATSKGGRCKQCEELLNYAQQRIERCPFMETKSFCSVCKVHCYEKGMRERVREVMRFSGPRMLLYHPVMAIRHLKETIQEKRT